jgi:hypothetical protein
MLSFRQYLKEVYFTRSPQSIFGSAATPFVLAATLSLPPEGQPPFIPDRMTIPTPIIDVPIYDKNWDAADRALSGANIGAVTGALSALRRGKPFKSLTPDEKKEKSHWWNDEPLPREGGLLSSLSPVGVEGRLGAEPNASMILGQRSENAFRQRIGDSEHSHPVNPDLAALDRIRNSKPIHHMTDEEAFHHGVDHALAMVRIPHESYGLPPTSPGEEPLRTSAHDSFHLGYNSAFDRAMTGGSFNSSFGTIPAESFSDPSERK